MIGREKVGADRRLSSRATSPENSDFEDKGDTRQIVRRLAHEPFILHQTTGFPKWQQVWFNGDMIMKSRCLGLVMLVSAGAVSSATADPIYATGAHSYSNAAVYSGHSEVQPRLRPVSHRLSGSAVLNLPGAKDVYTFQESAFQALPSRVLNLSATDPVNGMTHISRVFVSDIISEQAREQSIDPLIIDIIVSHESGGNPDATSSVGARGLMQLMPETAASLGVTDIDDPVQNISAGTRYFAEQYQRFGNLHMALAAYNAGPSSVADYGGVPPFPETVSYCSSIALEYQSRRRRH
jgi:hypothetical protein